VETNLMRIQADPDPKHCSTHYTPYSSHYTPHSTHYRYSTHYTPHFTLYNLHIHSTQCTPPSILCTILFTLNSALFTLFSRKLYSLFILISNHSISVSLNSIQCTPQSALFTLHFTLYSTHSPVSWECSRFCCSSSSSLCPPPSIIGILMSAIGTEI